jgi:hypothetical protein
MSCTRRLCVRAQCADIVQIFTLRARHEAHRPCNEPWTRYAISSTQRSQHSLAPAGAHAHGRLRHTHLINGATRPARLRAPAARALSLARLGPHARVQSCSPVMRFVNIRNYACWRIPSNRQHGTSRRAAWSTSICRATFCSHIMTCMQSYTTRLPRVRAPSLAVVSPQPVP